MPFQLKFKSRSIKELQLRHKLEKSFNADSVSTELNLNLLTILIINNKTFYYNLMTRFVSYEQFDKLSKKVVAPYFDI